MPRLALRSFTSSFSFTGSQNISTSIELPATGSIAMWLKLNRRYDFNTLWDSDGDTNRWETFYRASGLLTGRTHGTNAIGAADIGGFGRWFHVVQTWATSGTSVMYVNGVAFGFTAATQSGSSGTLLYWGGGNAGNTKGEFYMAEGQVYSSQLTAAQVSSLYSTGTPPINPTVWHKFDSTNGTTIPDYSGNGYTGTASASSYTSEVPLAPRTALSTPRLAVRNYNAALSFDGASAKVTSGSNVAVAADMTYSMWFFRRGIGATSAVPRLFRNTASGNAQLGIGSDGSGGIGNGIFGFGAWLSSGIRVENNRWYHVVARWNGTTNKLYLNGSLVFTGTNTAVSPGSGSLTIGATGSEGFNGIIVDFMQWNSLLTDSEIAAIYYNGSIPSQPLVWYKMIEGAGSTVTDYGTGANNGTITTATFTSNTPFKSRRLVNGNMVRNGDFEYAPPFTAATNTSARYIDGTSGGSTTNTLFGWGMTKSGTVTARFDPTVSHSGTNSLKISTTATGSYIETCSDAVTVTPLITAGGIRLQPSTSYTVSYWMKTNYVSGDATNGAFLQVVESNSTGGANVFNTGTKVKTTTDWTFYSFSFTTASATRNCVVAPTVYGHQGTATLIMDAWFDDIDLRPTTPVTRTAVS